MVVGREGGAGAAVAGGDLALVGGGGLELLGLVGVLGQAVGAARGAADIAQRRPVAGGIQVVVGVTIVRVALQTDLVFARYMRCSGGGIDAGARIAALDDITGWQIVERVAAVNRFYPECSAQHARSDIAWDVTGRSIAAVGAGRVRRAGQTAQRVAAKIAEFHDPMRIVAVGTLGMPVAQGGNTQLRPRFDHVLAATIGRCRTVHHGGVIEIAADVMHLRVDRNRHAPRQLEVRANIGHGGVGGDDAGGSVGMALIAGLFHGRIAAGFRSRRAVGAFAQQSTRALHGVRVMAVQATRLPDRQVGRELTLIGRRRLVGLGRHLRVGVRRGTPCAKPILLVTGQAEDVARFDKTGRALGFLETVQAKKFLVALGGIGFAYVGIVAGCTLDLAGAAGPGGFERQTRFVAGFAHTENAAVGRKSLRRVDRLEFAIASRQCVGKGQRDGMVIGQIDTQFARETRGIARAGRHDAPDTDAGHGNAHRTLNVGRPDSTQHIDVTDGQGAVMAGQAQL